MKREDIRKIAIAGTVDNFEAESHKQILDEASNYEFPEVFDSRVQNVSEDSTESILICADRIPRDPDGTQPDNIFVVDPQEDELIIQSEFEQEYVEHFIELYDDLLGDIELTVEELTITSKLDIKFDHVGIDIGAPDDFVPSGIQFLHESISHTIQSSEQIEPAIQQSGSEIVEESNTEEEFCIVISAVTEELSATDSLFLQESIDQIKQTLSRVLPENDD